MALSYNPVLLNQLVAPGISGFTRAEIPDLRDQHPQASYWSTNYFLNNIYGAIFSATLPPKDSRFLLNLIYRAQIIFSLYHKARESTNLFHSKSTQDNPNVSIYIETISLWESCFLNYLIFVDLLNKLHDSYKLDDQVFTKNDNSAEQRAHTISNAIKHWNPTETSIETMPMWLSNEGFHTSQYTLTYVEFSKIVDDIAKIADENYNLISQAMKSRKTSN